MFSVNEFWPRKLSLSVVFIFMSIRITHARWIDFQDNIWLHQDINRAIVSIFKLYSHAILSKLPPNYYHLRFQQNILINTINTSIFMYMKGLLIIKNISNNYYYSFFGIQTYTYINSSRRMYVHTYIRGSPIYESFHDEVSRRTAHKITRFSSCVRSEL